MTFNKFSSGDLIKKAAFLNSDPQTVTNKNEIAKALDESQARIMNIIGVWLSEGSGWAVKSVDNHYMNVVKYKPLNGSSYIQLPSELENSAKGLINLKNEDDECFRWCHIRHLNQ